MRLKKLNTGVVTSFPPNGGKISVNGTQENKLKYPLSYKPLNEPL